MLALYFCALRKSYWQHLTLLTPSTQKNPEAEAGVLRLGLAFVKTRNFFKASNESWH